MGGEILVVEDDADIGVLMKDLLEFEGYRVEIAENGSQAVEQLRSGFRPAIILLDLMMPVMDGYTFLKLREKDRSMRNIPVIITSAFHVDEQNIHNVQGLVSKPIDFKRLRQMIEDLTGAKEPQKAFIR